MAARVKILSHINNHLVNIRNADDNETDKQRDIGNIVKTGWIIAAVMNGTAIVIYTSSLPAIPRIIDKTIGEAAGQFLSMIVIGSVADNAIQPTAQLLSQLTKNTRWQLWGQPAILTI